MAKSLETHHRTTPAEQAPGAWASSVERAILALTSRCAAAPELFPRETARTVATALPAPLRTWLLRHLSSLGWLAPDAVIPFDILDAPDCPPPFRGPQRELVRLAVFGLPGQGLAWRDKHRHDLYQRLCAEILRTAVDNASLDAVASRTLSHPEVAGDPMLSSMLRSFIAERDASLRAERITPGEAYERAAHASKLRSGFSQHSICDFPTREELRDTHARLQHEFDRLLAQFEVTRAEQTLDRMRDLRRRFPVHIPAADLQRSEEQYDRLLRRVAQYRRQIETLADRGADAARAGDLETAGWIARRLDAIHTLLPSLLTEQQVAALREQIDRSGAEHENEEAARELTERKHAVATRIRHLAGVVQRFHDIANRLPPEHNAYRRAEANYRHALDEIRGLDTEWLTGLVLELETLLDDLDDPTGRMHDQLDQFIANVRTALNRLCLEIRARQRSRGTPPPPATNPPDDAPPPDQV